MGRHRSERNPVVVDTLAPDLALSDRWRPRSYGPPGAKAVSARTGRTGKARGRARLAEEPFRHLRRAGHYRCRFSRSRVSLQNKRLAISYPLAVDEVNLVGPGPRPRVLELLLTSGHVGFPLGLP